MSDFYSPRVILGFSQVDYEKDYKIPFGSFVQVQATDSDNTMTARTIDAIYLD